MSKISKDVIGQYISTGESDIEHIKDLIRNGADVNEFFEKSPPLV